MDIKTLRKKQAESIADKIGSKKLTAKDAMIKPVILKQDDKIDIIIKKLRKEDTNYVIVVDENDKFLGEITVENLIRIMVNASLNEPLVNLLDIGYSRSINYTTAKDYVVRHNNVVSSDESIIEVLRLIDKKNVNYIPVLNSKQKIIGVITPSSLLDLLSKN